MLTMIRRQVFLSLLAICLCCLTIDLTQAQENAQSQIPPSLVECYNTSYYMDRDNRLPSNIETLISLIEKVENSYGYNQDMRQLAVSLIHRFRQDGIKRVESVVPYPGVIPYSPTGFQFPKFKILLQRLIPGNAIKFPNNTLTSVERCSLHFMLSSSFDNEDVRGDRSETCSHLAKRIPSNFIEDVEILDKLQMKKPRRTSKQYGSYINGMNFDDGNGMNRCPVENGVIRTQWGSVSAGNLLAGIAAGLQAQSVPLRTLLALSSRSNGNQNARQKYTGNVDNRWAATVAGDLAEVALMQVPSSANMQAIIGASGAWNSTVMPKWYFLSQGKNLEMTVAEIRGGIDGLILALNIGSWPNLKLSQLLRMYYSLDGVLGSGIMACNRVNTFQSINNYEQIMMTQTSAFAMILHYETRLPFTILPDLITNFSLSATDALLSYLPKTLNCDWPTVPYDQEPAHITNRTSIMTDIFIFLDTNFEYHAVVDYINYVVQRLDVRPFGSSITLLSAMDGSVIVNRTFYITDFYENWNKSSHSWAKPGFSLPGILDKTQILAETIMKEESNANSLGGRSMIALMVLSPSVSITENDNNYYQQYVKYLNRTIPGLTFIYYCGKPMPLVCTLQEDLFPLSLDLQVENVAEPVVRKIRKVPRRLTNPHCVANGSSISYGSNQITVYEPLGHINFYSLFPQYFFNKNSMRYLEIKLLNSVDMTVCTSRSNPWPYNNSSQPNRKGEDCKQFTTSNFRFDLEDLCSGFHSLMNCPPLYLSVQTQSFAVANQVICNEAACSSPQDSQFLIEAHNLNCASKGSRNVLTKGLYLVVMVLVYKILKIN